MDVGGGDAKDRSVEDKSGDLVVSKADDEPTNRIKYVKSPLLSVCHNRCTLETPSTYPHPVPIPNDNTNRADLALNAMVDEFLRLRGYDSAHEALFRTCGVSGGVALSRRAVLSNAGLVGHPTPLSSAIASEVASSPQRSVIEIILECVRVHQGGFPSDRPAPPATLPTDPAALERHIRAQVNSRLVARTRAEAEAETQLAISGEKRKFKAEIQRIRVETESHYHNRLLAERRRFEAAEEAWSSRARGLREALERQKEITLAAARKLRSIEVSGESKVLYDIAAHTG